MLTSILSGGKWTSEIKSLYEEDKTGIQGTCHSFMVLDPDCFCGREIFKKEMDQYIKNIKESRKAENTTEILMPGEPEYRTEVARLKDGIPVPVATISELSSVAESLGLGSLSNWRKGESRDGGRGSLTKNEA